MQYALFRHFDRVQQAEEFSYTPITPVIARERSDRGNPFSQDASLQGEALVHRAIRILLNLRGRKLLFLLKSRLLLVNIGKRWYHTN